MRDVELIALLQLRLRQVAQANVATAYGCQSVEARLTSLPDDLAPYPAAAELSQRVRALAARGLPAQEAQLRLRQLLATAVDQLRQPRA